MRIKTPKMPLYSLVAFSLLLLFSIPVLFYWVANDNYYGRHVDDMAQDFELTDVQGKAHRLSKHRGRYVYLYFGYLNCNDVCHNQVGVMFNLHHQSRRDDLDFIFVTMDPKRDSPEMLDAYFNQFGTNFVSLTSNTMQSIQKVAGDYHAAFFPDGNPKLNQDYEISHPGAIYLIDPTGRLQLVYQGDLRYDMMLEDLQKLTLELNNPSK